MYNMVQFAASILPFVGPSLGTLYKHPNNQEQLEAALRDFEQAQCEARAAYNTSFGTISDEICELEHSLFARNDDQCSYIEIAVQTQALPALYNARLLAVNVAFLVLLVALTCVVI